MTTQEKLILRFLLSILVVGLIVSYVRTHWFSESLINQEVVNAYAKNINEVSQRNRTRYQVDANLNVNEIANSYIPGEPAGTYLEESRIINLNTATKSRLISLPGIGPAIADRILLHRRNYGDFNSVEDLIHVKGIGNKSIEKLKGLITVADTGGEKQQVK